MEKLGKIAKEPEYVDWLAEIDRVGGEFAWIRKEKRFPKNATGKERTIEEINQSVLASFMVRVSHFLIYKKIFRKPFGMKPSNEAFLKIQ